jgi:hypothetical protein
MTRARREPRFGGPRHLIVLVVLALAIMVPGSLPGAASARSGPFVSSTVGGVDLKKNPVLTGPVVWTASVSGSQVSKVEFLIDDKQLWTESSAPYRFHGDPTGVLDTTTLTNGNHRLAVVAYSTSGRTAVAKARVKISNRVQVTFTVASNVANGATVDGAVIWTASPQGAPVEDVQFLVDGVSRWTEAVAPYRFKGDPNGVLDTTTLDDGVHALAVVARANDGRIATDRISVKVATHVAPGKNQQTYPDAPNDLRVTDSSQQTSLTAAWTAVRGAVSYRIGRNGVALVDTTRTIHTWTGLSCGASYMLSVQPERSTSDTKGSVATVAARTASCSSTVSPPPPPPATPPPPSPAPPPPTAPPSPAPPPSPETPPVTFKGDFETGDIAPWQSTHWGGAQCKNYRVPAQGNLNLVKDVVAKGAFAARFDLPASGSSNSCELLRGRTIGLDDEWYSMEIRLPADWQEPSPAGWGMSLAQLNFQNIWGSPVSLIAHGDEVDLVLNAGLCTSLKSGNPGCQYTSGIGGNIPRQHIIPTSSFSTGAWHELLIHVKWTNSNDGILEGFHRLRGESAWTKTTALSGYPTLQRTADYTPTASDPTVDKIGAYRGLASFPVSIWQDNFCQGTVKAAVESCF